MGDRSARELRWLLKLLRWVEIGSRRKWLGYLVECCEIQSELRPPPALAPLGEGVSAKSRRSGAGGSGRL